MQVSADPRIQAIDCDTVLKEAKDSHAGLLELHDAIDAWRAAVWFTNKKAAEETMKDFGSKFALMLDFGRSMVGVVDEAKELGTAMKRVQTRHKNAIVGSLSSGGLPQGFATFLAETIEPRKGSDRYQSFQVGGQGGSMGFTNPLLGSP
jgi:hypothetical protein